MLTELVVETNILLLHLFHTILLKFSKIQKSAITSYKSTHKNSRITLYNDIKMRQFFAKSNTIQNYPELSFVIGADTIVACESS